MDLLQCILTSVYTSLILCGLSDVFAGYTVHKSYNNLCFF